MIRAAWWLLGGSVLIALSVMLGGCSSISSPDVPVIPPPPEDATGESSSSGHTGGVSFVEEPPDAHGYGVVNGWMLDSFDTTTFAAALRYYGWNTTHIELMGWSDTSAWGSEASIDDRLVKAHAFIATMRKHGITTFVNIVNANVGSGKYGDDKRWPVSKIPDAWFERIANYFCTEIGTELVVLQPWSEPRSTKVEKWAKYLQSRWPGRLCWNSDSRPSSHPAGYWAHEYHPASTSDVGKGAGCIVTTDHSSVLRQLGTWAGKTDTAALNAYAARCHAAGRGFIQYDFGRRGGWEVEVVEKCGRR